VIILGVKRIQGVAHDIYSRYLKVSYDSQSYTKEVDLSFDEYLDKEYDYVKVEITAYSPYTWDVLLYDGSGNFLKECTVDVNHPCVYGTPPSGGSSANYIQHTHGFTGVLKVPSLGWFWVSHTDDLSDSWNVPDVIQKIANDKRILKAEIKITQPTTLQYITIGSVKLNGVEVSNSYITGAKDFDGVITDKDVLSQIFGQSSLVLEAPVKSIMMHGEIDLQVEIDVVMQMTQDELNELQNEIKPSSTSQPSSSTPPNQNQPNQPNQPSTTDTWKTLEDILKYLPEIVILILIVYIISAIAGAFKR